MKLLQVDHSAVLISKEGARMEINLYWEQM